MVFDKGKKKKKLTKESKRCVFSFFSFSKALDKTQLKLKSNKEKTK
jgi:hypothetical protein